LEQDVKLQQDNIEKETPEENKNIKNKRQNSPRRLLKGKLHRK
jgi:hypothetical protein